MTIQLDRRPLAAGANGGGIKAPSKPFSKLLQNSRVLLQAFPNKALAVLWDFKELKVSKRPLMLSKFSPLTAPFLPHFAPVYDTFSRRRFHRGAATQIERLLNLTDNPVFGKKYPYFSRAVIGRFRTGLRPVPLDETGLPLFRTLRPLTDGASLIRSIRYSGRP